MVASAGSELAANLIKFPISILALVGWLFYQDWKFAFAALVVFPLCLVPVTIVGRRVRKSGGKEEQEAGMLMVTMHEAFTGIRVVKSLAREDHEIERFSDGSDKMERMIMRFRKAMEIVGPLVETVASLGIAAGLAYAWATGMSAQQFLVLYGALIAIYPTPRASPSSRSSCSAASSPPPRSSNSSTDRSTSPTQPDAVTLKNPRGAIDFRQRLVRLQKRHPRRRRHLAPHGAGQKIRAGRPERRRQEHAVLAAHALLRPARGRIMIDGIDIRDVTQQSLRDNIGMVNQDTFLFHDTIYENIRYGRLDATEEEIDEAARKAHAHEFILAQTKGYETVIGDKGCQPVRRPAAAARHRPRLRAQRARSCCSTRPPPRSTPNPSA